MPTEPRWFRGFRLDCVHLDTGAAERAEAVAFWLAQGALRDRAEGERRAGELVFLVRRPDGTLAGMSTVGLKVGADGWVVRCRTRTVSRICE